MRLMLAAARNQAEWVPVGRAQVGRAKSALAELGNISRPISGKPEIGIARIM